jgi:hypothetical protein
VTKPLLYRPGFPPPATRLPWPLFSFFVVYFGFASVTISKLKGFLEGFRAPSLFLLFAFGFFYLILDFDWVMQPWKAETDE